MKTIRTTHQRISHSSAGHRTLFTLALFALIGLAFCRPAAAQTFTVQDLDTSNEDVDSVAVSISNYFSIVVGNGHKFVDVPFAFSSILGQMLPFAAPNGYFEAQVSAINGLNVVGTASDPSHNSRAVIWPNTGAPVLLPIPFTSSSSVATGINASGKVVGAAYFPGLPANNAYIWNSANKTYWFLGWDILGGVGSFANAINDKDWVVGAATIADNLHFHAFLWINKKTIDLHNSNNLFGGNLSAALAINNAGGVVGWATTMNGYPHAFLNYTNPLNSKRTMLDLKTLPGCVQSKAYGINSAGKVVGWSGSSWDETDGHAFLYDGSLKDLNAHIPANSGWILRAARGINDAGQIVGWGVHNGDSHAFLLTPQ